MRRPELDESGPSLFQHRPNSAGDCRLDYLTTVKVRVVVSETLPLVPLMVMTWVPVGALLETVRVKSDVPEPVTEVGLKLPVTPVGMPVAESATAESNPPVAVTVTTAYPLWPRASEPEVGETERLNPPVTGAVTVRVKVVVLVRLELVPVTVMV
jgi:hypothetical protein